MYGLDRKNRKATSVIHPRQRHLVIPSFPQHECNKKELNCRREVTGQLAEVHLSTEGISWLLKIDNRRLDFRH